MAKHGPKRKSGARYPSGRLRPGRDGPTPELARRRLAAVGDATRPEAENYIERARSARYASCLLDVLFARALIDVRDHNAGQRYAGAYRRVPHVATGFTVSRPDQIPGARPLGDTVIGGDDSRSKFSAARRALEQRGARVTTVVERLLLYEQAIEASELPLLREGLAALDQHFQRR